MTNKQDGGKDGQPANRRIKEERIDRRKIAHSNVRVPLGAKRQQRKSLAAILMAEEAASLIVSQRQYG